MTETPPTSLYPALLAAMKVCGKVIKNATNPHLKSKYADLGSVLDTIEQPLWDNGLLIVQRFTHDQGGAILVTELIHAASGERIASEVPVVSKDPTDPQKIGAAITYYRRYSLLALLGLAPEDDDGHAASQPKPQARGDYGVVAYEPANQPPREQSRRSDSPPPTSTGPAAAPTVAAGTPKRSLAEVERELAPLAKQVRLNDEALSGPEYQRYHDLEAERKALYTDLRDTIHDEADPKKRRMALHLFYESADTPARLTQRVKAVEKSGLPTEDLDDAFRYHHDRLSKELVPASIAG